MVVTIGYIYAVKVIVPCTRITCLAMNCQRFMGQELDLWGVVLGLPVVWLPPDSALHLFQLPVPNRYPTTRRCILPTQQERGQ
jgi:hypothetical protein